MSTDIVLLLVGIVVGAMNSIAGGGMLFGFPVMLAVGMPPIIANATSHVAVLPGQIGALFGYKNYLKKISPLYLWLTLPLAIGAIIGANLLKNTSADKFEQLIPVLLFLAVGLFVIEPFLHFHIHTHLKSKKKNMAMLALIGISLIPIAIYGGYFGVGFGFMLLAFLGLTTISDIHKLNAIKNVGTFVIAICTTLTLLTSGLIDWHTALIMAVGCGIGGYYGARLAQKFSSHAIRIAVICIGIVSVYYLFARTY